MSLGETPEERAADKAGDLDRLMPGEDPTTTYIDDALHWLGVYGELLEFKRSLIKFTKQNVATLSEPASDEVATTDMVMMAAELERLQARHDFWEGRRRDLS